MPTTVPVFSPRAGVFPITPEGADDPDGEETAVDVVLGTEGTGAVDDSWGAMIEIVNVCDSLEESAGEVAVSVAETWDPMALEGGVPWIPMKAALYESHDADSGIVTATESPDSLKSDGDIM